MVQVGRKERRSMERRLRASPDKVLTIEVPSAGRAELGRSSGEGPGLPTVGHSRAPAQPSRVWGAATCQALAHVRGHTLQGGHPATSKRNKTSKIAGQMASSSGSVLWGKGQTESGRLRSDNEEIRERLRGLEGDGGVFLAGV